MLPDSQKGFAPVIHGIARGTAQVSVKQNGYEIYQSTVPPGPFTINDLYAAGNGGDLQVTIKEADGSSQVFTVPTRPFRCSSARAIPAMPLPPASTAAAAISRKTEIFPGYRCTASRRAGRCTAPSWRTATAPLTSAGKNMGELGALSLDITQANATLPDDSDRQGQSVRFLYNKSLTDTGTNIQLVGYATRRAALQLRRYHLQPDERLQRRDPDGVIDEAKFTDYYNLAYNKRGKAASVTQQLGRTATLYLSGSHQTYWGPEADQQLQAGLNAAVDDINWTLSYSLTKNAWQQGRDQMLAVNVNIPFSHWLRSDSKSAWRHASASYSMSNDLNGRTTSLAGLYGTLLEDNNLSYSMQTTPRR
jgi:outer membrane usher protein